MRALVAVDITARPEDVVKHAAVWAERVGASLDLVYVDEIAALATYMADPAMTAVIVREQPRLHEARLARLNALLEGVPPALRGQVRVVVGSPAEAVVEASEGFDLLIVATHGRRGLAHLWLGSVAEKIVRAAAVPVLVLHLGPADHGGAA